MPFRVGGWNVVRSRARRTSSRGERACSRGRSTTTRPGRGCCRTRRAARRSCRGSSGRGSRSRGADLWTTPGRVARRLALARRPAGRRCASARRCAPSSRRRSACARPPSASSPYGRAVEDIARPRGPRPALVPRRDRRRPRRAATGRSAPRCSRPASRPPSARGSRASCSTNAERNLPFYGQPRLRGRARGRDARRAAARVGHGPQAARLAGRDAEALSRPARSPP